METIRYTKMDIDHIISVLIDGGIVAFPTDTVFGLASKMEEDAMNRIYEAKGRSFEKALPMMCDSYEMISRVAEVNDETKKIIEAFMPGPLTIVFNKKDSVPDYVTNGKKTIGIRVPDDEFILELIRKMKAPLMVTSANISGDGSLLKWEDVYACMNGRIDAIVCEDARGDKASTIIDVTDGIRVLRDGPLSLKEIKEILE